MTPAEEARFIELWTQGLETAEIARRLGIPVGTVSSRAHVLQLRGKIQARPRGGAHARRVAQARTSDEGTPPEHPGTPATRQRYTGAHPSTPEPSELEPTGVHPSTPAPQSTAVHLGVPLPDDLATRLLSLLPDLETIVARERDRQRLLSTPIGTPQHTTKKTYVVDTLYVDLIERYAQAEGVELKDVVNLAFQEFFERQDYLPTEGR
jgi:hypothetical protein